MNFREHMTERVKSSLGHNEMILTHTMESSYGKSLKTGKMLFRRIS